MLQQRQNISARISRTGVGPEHCTQREACAGLKVGEGMTRSKVVEVENTIVFNIDKEEE